MAGPLKRIKTYLKSSNARIHIAEAAMLAGVAVIVLRLFWLQAVDADNYKEDAYRQYTSELTITAKRGTIYDRNMNELAVNPDGRDGVPFSGDHRLKRIYAKSPRACRAFSE